MTFDLIIRWSLIAGRLPGRTDNEVKNYWNSHLRRKLMNMGIDPKNHRPTNAAILPRPHNHPPQMLKTRAGTFNDEPVEIESKSPRGDDQNNCEQVSDGRSCLEDDSSCGLPDLNLDLTVHLSCKDPTHHLYLKNKSEIFASSTTLPLFR